MSQKSIFMTINKKRVYSILEIERNKDYVNFLIKIDFSHPVFQGHFPGKSVLPGVMTCDIVRHLVSDTLEHKVQLVFAKNIKFLKMIVPSEDNTYNVKIAIIKEQEKYNIKASISQNKYTYFKLNGEYKRK